MALGIFLYLEKHHPKHQQTITPHLAAAGIRRVGGHFDGQLFAGLGTDPARQRPGSLEADSLEAASHHARGLFGTGADGFGGAEPIVPCDLEALPTHMIYTILGLKHMHLFVL